MPKRAMRLAAGEPENLVVHWGAFFRNARVELAGREVLSFGSRAAFKNGATATLPDGSQLFVRLVRSTMTVGIEVLRDGHPVPGSSTHPEFEIRQAMWVFLVIGVLTSLVSLVAFANDTLTGALTLAEGLLFLGFAYGAHRQSKRAILAGAVVLALDTVFTLHDAITQAGPAGGGSVVGAVVMRTLFFVVLYRALRAFDRLRQIVPREAARVFE